MTNPYRIEGPALISFSGGRTSAYMLRHILDAHDGQLPADVHVCFANTGKEREETLRFVHECGSRWGVDIRWLEWRSYHKRRPVHERFEEVGFNSASRKGEPFRALIEAKKAVPNAAHRWCTEHLKMQVLANFMEGMGYTIWLNVVGLRADEARRLAKKDRQNQAAADPWRSVMPMAKAKVRKPDVVRFWFGQDQIDLTIPQHLLPQGFDLGLHDYEGNCDQCFLKAYELLCHIERERQGTANWWIESERFAGATFVTEYSYSQMQRDARAQPTMAVVRDLPEFDAECGVSGTDHRIRCGARKEAA